MRRLIVALFGDPDATVVVRRAPKPGVRAVVLALLGLALALAVILGRHSAPLLPRPGAPAPQAAHAVAALPDYALASEADLLAAPARSLSVWRFRDDPAVLVIIFPSLHAQAVAMNRIAAFCEKAGMPHDRVVDAAALTGAIAAAHGTFDTYYYAHDYRAADLARFYAAASRQGLAQGPAEQALQSVLQAAGLLRPGANAALITLPPPGPGLLDPSGRRAILRHELSHGYFFTDPAYAALVARFWAATLTAAQRAGFRAFLGRSGYDTENDELMRNEMQAYLMFTPDARLFSPSDAGLSSTDAGLLRAALRGGLPAGWLADSSLGP